MPPEAKGATAEGFPTGEQRPAVRRDTRPEDRNEAPRSGAGEHGGERPEGEGLKEHPQTLPDRPATNQPPIARCRISRGGRGGSRAPPYVTASTTPRQREKSTQPETDAREGLRQNRPPG